MIIFQEYLRAYLDRYMLKCYIPRFGHFLEGIFYLVTFYSLFLGTM